jgi:DNA-directed RNA polymerase subunit RPC12/RpoP
MARSGTKPGKGSYTCSKCGAVEQVKASTSTLKACRNCGGSLFRKPHATKPVA